MKFPEHINIIHALFRRMGARLFAVGGCVRDSLLSIEPKDIDLATDFTPKEMLSFDGTIEEGWEVKCLPIGVEFGTVVFVFSKGDENHRVEITTLRRDTCCDGRRAKVEFTDCIYEDLERRDLTINAMAIDLDVPNRIIDPFGGKADLKNHKIRTVGTAVERIKEDFLRMLRACRFVGYHLENTLDSELVRVTRRNAHELKNISKERIREEILKMMKCISPKACVEAMRETGLLVHVIPELAECINIDQNSHHAETVYEHCIDACEALPAEKPLLRLAGLLHDIGKPASKGGEGPNCTFHSHEHFGKDIARNWMERIKFSNEEIKYVCTLIENHMFHFDLKTKRKTLKKWMKTIEGLEMDLMYLRMADRMANKAKANLGPVTFFMWDLAEKIHEIKTHKEPMKIKDLAINGKDLIEIGFKPGPVFSKILNTLLERVLENPELNEKEKLLLEIKNLNLEEKG